MAQVKALLRGAVERSQGARRPLPPETPLDVYRIKVPATLQQSGRSWSVRTEFVGFRGVIIWTDTLPASEKLLKVTLPLLPGEPVMTAHAVPRRLHGVAHLGNALAVGLDWYALDPATSARWHRFVRSLRERFPEARTRLVDLSPEPSEDPVRRRASRDRRTYTVSFCVGDQTQRCSTVDVSATGMFLATTFDVPLGTRLHGELTQPGTEDRWRITMVVRRRVLPPSVPGLGVELQEKVRVEPPKEATEPERTGPMAVSKVTPLPRSEDPRKRSGTRSTFRPEALEEERRVPAAGGFELVLNDGRKLKVPANFEADALAKLLAVLQAEPTGTPTEAPAGPLRKARG
ncbi:MAG: PilZ domain-containing protein [Deltaproteobacteria bacterium]|nr:PilZ domain-containing protein [Deltaproteobacteria bacterium]